MENKPLTLSGKFITIPIGKEIPAWVYAVEELLKVPEVRKAAANWATDELIEIRELIDQAKNPG